MAEVEKPKVFAWNDLEWDSLKKSDKAPSKVQEDAIRMGLKKKRVVVGEGGFYLNHTFFPAGFNVPEHSHDHDELMVVLKGGCKFDDGITAGPDDTVVIHATYRYGFTCGPEGMEFLVIRYGEKKYGTSWA